MTSSERAVILAVKYGGPARCSVIGIRAWGISPHAPSVDGGSHSSNRHARSAGKILRRLEATGLVRQARDLTWLLTVKGVAAHLLICKGGNP